MRSVLGFPAFTLLYVWRHAIELSASRTGPAGDLCLSLGKFTRSDYKFMTSTAALSTPKLGDKHTGGGGDVDADEPAPTTAPIDAAAKVEEPRLFWYVPSIVT